MCIEIISCFSFRQTTKPVDPHRSSALDFRVRDNAVYSIRSNCCTYVAEKASAQADRQAFFFFVESIQPKHNASSTISTYFKAFH